MATNRDIRKKRTLVYFIEAAQQIIREEGISKVTIRDVAGRAGYNSATLYNYFDDRDQLILYASLKYLNLYNMEVAEQVTEDMTEREKLMLMWEAFCRFSFEYPEAYANIFMNRHSENLQEILERYYELFPEERETPLGVLESYGLTFSLLKRNRMALERLCAEEGFGTDGIDVPNELLIYTYKGLMGEYLNSRKSERQSSPYEERMMECLRYVLQTL